MAAPETELSWLGISTDEADEDGERNLLADYYSEVAAGPMTSYRYIFQSGGKKGQSYYAHVMDGINVLHKLRVAGVVEISELEEQLLLIAFTIHDINKIPPYGVRDSKESYARIATTANISKELERLQIERFTTDWRDYIEDIRLLAHLHQHDKQPLEDLDRRNRPSYLLDYDRLVQLGKLMYAADNLDLSHTLAEPDHKAAFLRSVNAIAEQPWRWETHRLGENRGLLSNIIHNCVVAYLRDRHPRIVDLLYYSEGVAYLLPGGEQFSWSVADTEAVAQRVAQAVAGKQGASISQFIKASPAGIKADRAAIEGGASYNDILWEMRRIVERKSYKEEWHAGYSARLHDDITEAAKSSATAASATALLAGTQPIVPLAKDAFQRGELAAAYRNLLEGHLKLNLGKQTPWQRVYSLLGLETEQQALADQVDPYRRGYFIARDNATSDTVDTLFERLMADVAALAGEHEAAPADSRDFVTYLATNLEIGSSSGPRNFRAQLERYVKDEHRQCSNCSSSLPTETWVIANAPSSIGVQNFSNRLVGGSSREPARNICPLCRAQFILEKLAWASHRDKHGGEYTSFYLHLYPYSFFTASYLGAMWVALKGTSREDNTAFFLQAGGYFQRWGEKFDLELKYGLKRQVAAMDRAGRSDFTGYSTKVNGVGIPNFSDAVGNTPTLPLNAPGKNYGQQFLFALTHALMVADFFGCRVVMSRTPVPLFTGEYMDDNRLAFFVDGTPRNLRWLLPTDEYRSLETYRDDEGGRVYEQRRDHWGDEQRYPGNQAAFENISKRLWALYQLSRQLTSTDADELLLDLATAAADDPLAIYHIVDRAIEKKIKSGDGGKGKAAKASNPELLATSLSKRVAPLLEQIVKE